MGVLIYFGILGAPFEENGAFWIFKLSKQFLIEIEFLGFHFDENCAFWIFHPLKILPKRWLGLKLPKFNNFYDIEN